MLVRGPLLLAARTYARTGTDITLKYKRVKNMTCRVLVNKTKKNHRNGRCGTSGIRRAVRSVRL